MFSAVQEMVEFSRSRNLGVQFPEKYLDESKVYSTSDQQNISMTL